MTTSREENARTLAAALGSTEGEVAHLLDTTVVVTRDPDGERLGGFIQALLARTLANVTSTPQIGVVPAVEIIVGGAAARTNAAAISVSVDGFRADVRDGRLASHGPASYPIVELLAASYATAAAIHRAIGGALPIPVRLPIEFDLVELYGAGISQILLPIDLGSCFMAGAGAIGNAVVLGLSMLDVHGELNVSDPDVVSDGNLNRCWWFSRDDLGELKAERLASLAQSALPHLRLIPHARTMSDAIKALGSPPIESLVVAVDSRRARRTLQNEMPRRVYDASTSGITEVVLHFNETGSDLACLSCVYFESPDEGAHEKHVADGLGVSVDAVRLNFVTPDAAQAISRKYPQLEATGIEGLAYDSLFKSLCGKGEIVSGASERVLAPFGFVSVLAGLLLSIEIVLRAGTAARTQDYNYWRVSPWHPPISRMRECRMTRHGCEFCDNPVLQNVARSLWG